MNLKKNKSGREGRKGNMNGRLDHDRGSAAWPFFSKNKSRLSTFKRTWAVWEVGMYLPFLTSFHGLSALSLLLALCVV